jgi:hypothetical protein
VVPREEEVEGGVGCCCQSDQKAEYDKKVIVAKLKALEDTEALAEEGKKSD